MKSLHRSGIEDVDWAVTGFEVRDSGRKWQGHVVGLDILVELQKLLFVVLIR